MTIWDAANPYRYAEVRGTCPARSVAIRPGTTSTPCRSGTWARLRRRDRERAGGACGSIPFARSCGAEMADAPEGPERPEADPLVGVVMGSASDWSTMRAPVAVLERFAVPHEARSSAPTGCPTRCSPSPRPPRVVGCGRSSPAPVAPPTSRDARRQDHRARARRAGGVAPSAGPGLAAVDRADAGRRAGRNLRHRRGRRHERRAVRGCDAGR